MEMGPEVKLATPVLGIYTEDKTQSCLQSAVWVEGIGVVQKWPEGGQHLHKPTGTSFTPEVHVLATDTNNVT